jgi:hypothetical protein
MGKADWCEAYEQMQAEQYGYEKAIKKKRKLIIQNIYPILFEMKSKRVNNLCEKSELVVETANKILDKIFEGDKMVKLIRIDEPELNSKVYFTVSENGLYPCIVIDGSYIYHGRISNRWTWINLKTQNIERGEGMFWEAIGVPQINEDKTEQELLRDFVLDVFGWQ